MKSTKQQRIDRALTIMDKMDELMIELRRMEIEADNTVILKRSLKLASVPVADDDDSN